MASSGLYCLSVGQELPELLRSTVEVVQAQEVDRASELVGDANLGLSIQ
jgi:hypothetical protein